MESSSNKRPVFLRSGLAITAISVLGLFTPGSRSPWAAPQSANITLSGFVSPSTSISVIESHDLEAVDLQNGGNGIEIARISMRINNRDGLRFGIKSHNGNVLMHHSTKGPSYTINFDSPLDAEGRSPAQANSVVVLRMDLQPMPVGQTIKQTTPFSDTLVFSISAL